MNAAMIISIAVFFSILLLLAGAYSYYGAQKGRRQIVDKIKAAEESLILDKKSGHGVSAQEGGKGYFQQFISSLGHRVTPRDEEEIFGLRMRLLQAGYRRHNASLAFFGYKTFFSVLFPVIFFFSKVVFVRSVPPGSFLTIAVLLAVTGFYLPNLWLKIKINGRQQKMLEGFPDALDLMVVCVEAGMGLDAAINRVGEEMKLRNAVVSEEFRLMGLELRAGKLRRDALRNLGIRTGLDDVKSLMTLLIQTDKFGTSVAQALRVHSDSMRTKRYQKAEEIAAKLPVKLVFPLILFIFPSLFVVIIGPAVIRIFRVLLPALGGQ
jgi:tight adherence protein C